MNLAAAAGELSAPRPDLSFARVEDDSELALRDLDDTTVVLNFWATWCIACVAEMPELEALHQRLGQRVRFFGVSLDEGRPTEAVRTFLAERGVTYEQLWGDVAQQQPFVSLANAPPGTIPVTAVIHQGTIRDVRVGKVDGEELGAMLERLLEE